jgi:phosphoribosylglycinamide formyltransferase 1
MNLGFLASHNGSNVKAILDNIENGYLAANPKIIISNNTDAGVLEIAKNKDIPHYCINSQNIPEQHASIDNAIVGTLKAHDVDLVILAGYMKLLGKEILTAYPNRILNVHPSLLPRHGGKGMYGMNVHQEVIDSKDEITGATIHLVNQEYDQGRILAQSEVRVFPEDTANELASRVLKTEHHLYSQTLKEILEGNIDLD